MWTIVQFCFYAQIKNHSIQYSIQKEKQIIHSKNLFIKIKSRIIHAKNLFIQIGKSYSKREVKYAKVKHEKLS